MERDEEGDEEGDEGRDEEEDEEERGHYYEREYLDENEIDPEQGQCHSNSSHLDSPQSVAYGEEGIRQTPIESSPTMPGSLYARSPPPEPHISKVHPTRSRHVRFAPGVTSPAVRPPRRTLAYSPKTLAVTPGQIDSPDPPDLQPLYPTKPKESPNLNHRKPQEVAKQSAGSRRIIPSPSPNRILKSFMQHPEPEPTRRVERRLSSSVDETVDGFIPADSSFDRSMELERICQLEKEIKMLREEVSDSVAQTRRSLIKMTL